MQVLKEKTKYGRKLEERIPTNYPFFLRNDKKSYPDTYKEDFNYCIILVDSRTQKPVDIRIVKTVATLEEFIKDKHIRHKMDILFHPNPIRLEADFWEEYRQAKNGAERLKLFADRKVLADTNMLLIDTITIDIDSPFEKAIQVLNNLTKDLDIPVEVLEVRKTKSGNLRFSFNIKPVKPNNLNKNGKTDLQNAKEFVSLINRYFENRGLKADYSFKRINHPVWITKPEELVLKPEAEIEFYTLYRKAKEYYNKQRAKNKTKQQKKEAKSKRKIAYLPAFVANKFTKVEQDTALEKAVETLAKTHRKGRYIHFLQVVAGWCKWLGKEYWEYYNLVYTHARDKKKDIETAWRYARPLEFNEYTQKRKYDLVEYADRAINYLKENGATPRQELLREVFDNQSWLEQEVMRMLKEEGLIEEYFEKQEIGRPKKVYNLKNKEEKPSKDTSSTSTKKTGVRAGISTKQGISIFRRFNSSLFREHTGGGWLFYFLLPKYFSFFPFEFFAKLNFRGNKGLKIIPSDAFLFRKSFFVFLFMYQNINFGVFKPLILFCILCILFVLEGLREEKLRD